MKNLNLKLAGVVAFSLFSVSTFAQNWRTGGNAPCPGPQCVDNTNNILGTIDNVPLRVITNNVQRLHINQNIGLTSGFIGMGNGFNAPQSQIHLNDGKLPTYLQITNFLTNTLPLNPSATDGFKLGIASDGTAEIRQQENLPINFFTNNIPRATILNNNGFIGIGTNFNNPQSLVHLNNNQNTETWQQITNSTTGQAATDGLRLGIVNQNLFGYVGPAAYLRWHEQTPFIIQVAGPTSAGGQNINQSERIRITTIGSPNPDPFNISGDLTRIGISHDGLDHIDRVRSLLHLGYNTGESLNNINLNDGWRDWMDIGTFTNNGRENMYFGLMQMSDEIISAIPEESRYDAIINWGDNELTPADGQFNNLRFIYTTPQTGTINIPQSQNDGLETMRIEPTVATTLAAPNFGMMGIGDWTTAPNIAAPIDAKLDIDGDLRIRTVTQDNTLTQILAIDPTDQNRVHWIDAVGSIGNNCSDPQNPLTSDYEIPLGNQNYYFTGQGAFARVGVGVPVIYHYCYLNLM